MSVSVDKFKAIASQKKFQGWPLIGGYQLGEKIPFFGQILKYTLQTGNGQEEYFSLLRNFGWAVVFGLTKENKVLTLAQWKPGVNQASWELPPGGIGKIPAGTSEAEITATTKKIFLSETGYGNGSFQLLQTILVETGKYRGPGPNDHGLPAYLFLATGLEKIQDARSPNRNEIMETIEVPLAEVSDIIESGLFNEVSALPCALLAMMKLEKLKWSND